MVNKIKPSKFTEGVIWLVEMFYTTEERFIPTMEHGVTERQGELILTGMKESAPFTVFRLVKYKREEETTKYPSKYPPLKVEQIPPTSILKKDEPCW